MHAVQDKTLTLGPWALSLVIFVFSIFSTWTYIAHTPIGAPPDELAHLTYVQEIAEDGRWIPDYANSRIINSSSGNYLNHPPLYYSILGLTGRLFDWKAVEQYREFRWLSAILIAIGLALWVWIMFLWGWTPIDSMAVVGAALAVPMFSYLAGSVNNDNFAFLGVTIVLLALSLRGVWPRSAYLIGALGVVVVMLGKATAAVFITILMLAWVFFRWRSGENLLRNRYFLIALLAAGLACAAYYVPIFLVYGELFPKAGSLYGNMVPGDLMGFRDFTVVFLRTMLDRLPLVMSHQSYAPLPGFVEAIFYIMLLVPLATWLVSRPISPPSKSRDLSDAFMVALLSTFALHLWVVWLGYQKTGLLAGIQPRYYSYALPGIFFFCFVDGFDFRVKRWAFLAFSTSVAACLAFSLASSAKGLVEQKEQPQRPVLAFDASGARRVTLAVSVREGDAGYVDQLARERETITLRGWAIDAASKTHSPGVLITYDGRLIGTIPTGGLRPDVAKALGTSLSNDSGFTAVIRAVPKRVNMCAIEALAQQRDGSLRRLRRPECP